MKTHKKVLKVDNLANFEFWLGMFRPRTKKWQKETLKRLKAGKDNPFANPEEAGDKIKALEFLLNG